MFCLSRRIALNAQAAGLRFQSTAAYTEMMTVLKGDLKKAMLAKDNMKKNTVRSIMSAVKNKELENQYHKTPKTNNEFELYDILLKLVNQREEAIQQYLQSNREDSAQQEREEQSLLKEYLAKLPVATNEEIEVKVKDIYNELAVSFGDKPILPKDIFAKIPWKSVETEWKAASGAVKQVVVKVHTELSAK